MLRAGDTIPCRVRLLTEAGEPVDALADKDAFTGAGWSILYTVDGLDIPAPTWSFVVIDDTLGEYEIHLVVELGGGYLTVLAPGTAEAWPRTRPLAAGIYDLDGVAALITSSNGTPVAAGTAVSYSFAVKEGDSFLDLVTFPAIALSPWGYTDFTEDTDGAWEFESACRTRENRIAADPDFVLRAVLFDAATRKVAIGFNPFPEGAELSDSDATQESKAFLLDVQAQKWKGFAITAINQGTKTITISGDQRRFLGLDEDPVVPLRIAGSTGNDGNFTVASIALGSGTTEITVVEALPSAVADGRLQIRITVSPIDGQITVRRQEVRA